MKEAIEEIAWLKAKLYVAGEIDSLEHLVGLERLAVKELEEKVDEFKVITNISMAAI